ncbi:unnamed protein product [Clavelina lepadiformis]|uniref:Peptidyl-prolyl cis-trans isomerase n=1 Tax=Clavelina lepadiformis TaxID=159417 RepID=A0ABP0FIY6_CLALP
MKVDDSSSPAPSKNAKAEKVGLKDKKKVKVNGKVLQKKEEKKERRKERKKEKENVSSPAMICLKTFCRNHYLICAISVVSLAFLIALYMSVDALDRGGAPKVTDYVSMKIKVEGGSRGTVVFGLYGQHCPKTVQNFVMLCTQQKGYGYINSRFFMLLPNHFLMGGDIVNNDGTSGKSALDEPFEGENLKLKHQTKGNIGMVSLKDNEDSKRSSQFYITMKEMKEFDGKSVVFGHVIDGLYFLETLHRLPVDEKFKPLQNITIVSATVH